MAKLQGVYLNEIKKLDITFETQCYENDWEYLLKTKYLDQMIANCNYEFTCKNIIINNVSNRNMVDFYARKKLEAKIIDQYYFVDDYIDEALDFFDINKEDARNKKGYYYLTSAIVGLYLSKTEYLLHFTTDAFFPEKDTSNWMLEASKIFAEFPNVIAANPTWLYKFDSARRIANGKTLYNFYLGQGFTDHCYFVKTQNLKKSIYNYSHPESQHYPKYGDGGFEKRLHSYMKTKEKLRITSMNLSYIHSNFPRSKLSKMITIILINLNMYFPMKKMRYKNVIIRNIFSMIKKTEDFVKKLLKNCLGDFHYEKIKKLVSKKGK